MYSMVTIIYITIVHIWKFAKRVDLESSYHKKEKMQLCGDGC